MKPARDTNSLWLNMIIQDGGQSLQKHESQKIRETESKTSSNSYTTFLYYYLHNSLQNRVNGRLV